MVLVAETRGASILILGSGPVLDAFFRWFLDVVVTLARVVGMVLVNAVVVVLIGITGSVLVLAAEGISILLGVIVTILAKIAVILLTEVIIEVFSIGTTDEEALRRSSSAVSCFGSGRSDMSTASTQAWISLLFAELDGGELLIRGRKARAIVYGIRMWIGKAG